MKKELSLKRKILFIFLIFLFFFLLSLMVAEFMLRIIEKNYASEGNYKSLYHKTLGWVPEPNTYMLQRNREFEAYYKINSLSMNDNEINDDKSIKNIIALGDSHTFAVGVSYNETWPNKLENKLNESNNTTRYQVLNTGVPGYNLGQYLVMYRILKIKFDPEYIIIGFSMATDLYDLIPPNRGGFVYGAYKGRTYFELDSDNNLIQIDDLIGVENLNQEQYLKVEDTNLRWKAILERFALFRRFKRSKLALRISAKYKPKGKSLWPGLDTALKINLTGDDEYRWMLAEKIIEQISLEAKKAGTKVILLNIPYLAQVYDDVWENSFGLNEQLYDRWIASKRLKNISRKNNIFFIDTTEAFVENYKKNNRWLHYKIDAHPTAEGHELIADVIVKDKNTGLLH